MKLRLTCKEAAGLLLAREDRALALSDQVVLRLHLAACKACPAFEQQLLTMRKALQNWRNAAEAGDSPP